MDWILENLLIRDSEEDCFVPLPLYLDLEYQTIDQVDEEKEDEKSRVIIIEI